MRARLCGHPFGHSRVIPSCYLERTVGDRRVAHWLTGGGGGSVLSCIRHACGPIVPTIPASRSPPGACSAEHTSKGKRARKLQWPPNDDDPWSPTDYYRAGAGAGPQGSLLSPHVPNVDVRYRLHGPGHARQLVAVLEATVDIKAGTELLLDYQRPARTVIQALASPPCNCWNIYCRMKIRTFLNRWPCYRFERVRLFSVYLSSYPFTYLSLSLSLSLPGLTHCNQLRYPDPCSGRFKANYLPVTASPLPQPCSQYAQCLQIAGLARPLHVGDIVLLGATLGSAEPGVGLHLRQPRYAQVLLFAAFTADNSHPWIAYRICQPCSGEPPVQLRLTNLIIIRDLSDLRLAPLAILPVVPPGGSSATPSVRSPSHVPRPPMTIQ